MQIAIPKRHICWLAAVVLVGCGGPSSAGPGAKSGEGSEQSAGENGESGPSGPQLPSCDDGSCFRCGDTICLPGYYCEKDGASQGCAWNAKCASNATCGCLSDELARDPSCSCEDRDGRAFVTCGG